MMLSDGGISYKKKKLSLLKKYLIIDKFLKESVEGMPGIQLKLEMVKF